MIESIVKQWDQNKHKLEEYFRNTDQKEYDSYGAIVKKLFELVMPMANDYEKFDLSRMTIINDGDYQGTEIFIIPTNTYQPSCEDYIVTNTYYGSCSGCDALLSIRNSFDDGLPNDEQVTQYMMLALHLIQKCKWLYGAEENNVF